MFQGMAVGGVGGMGGRQGVLRWGDESDTPGSSMRQFRFQPRGRMPKGLGSGTWPMP